MPPIMPLVWGALVASGCVAIILLGLSFARRAEGAERDARRLRAVPGMFGVGLAFVGAAAVIVGVPRGMPARAEDWLAWIALAALVAGACDAAGARRLGEALRPAILVAGAMVSLRTVVSAWSPAHAAATVAVMAFFGTAFLLSLDSLARRSAPAWSWILLAGTCLGVGIALAAGGSMKLGQLAGSLGIACAVGALLCAMIPTLRRSPVDGRIAGVLLPVLLAHGTLLGSLVPVGAIVISLAPAAALGIDLVPLVRATGWRREVARAATAAFVLGVGIALAAFAGST